MLIFIVAMVFSPILTKCGLKGEDTMAERTLFPRSSSLAKFGVDSGVDSGATVVQNEPFIINTR